LIEPTYRWLEPQPAPPPDELQAALGLHPLVASALCRRGHTPEARARAFLDPNFYAPTSAGELPGMQTAVARLVDAIRRGEHIGVWGDFDVDGQTSTSILVAGLRRLGARVSYYIPVRARESHGVHLGALKTFIDSGVQVLLTCDTGITAHASITYAKTRGVDTVLTDHHSLPPELPAACAIVNPQLLPREHPLADLSGAGVAFKVSEALHAALGRSGEIEQDYDLVAMGTVADQVLLTGDNRYLVQRGMQVLREGQRPALRAMLELAETDLMNLNEEHIGFVLAPRLNALGRLDDANPIVEFLTGSDSQLIKQIASHLEGMNARRKLLQKQVLDGALAQIEQDPHLLDEAVLVLSHPNWPGGVNGIVASHLVEQFQRPAILLTAPPGGTARGSARSVEGVNITSALRQCEHLLDTYGGHSMAAGMALEAARIPEFRRALSKAVLKQSGGALPEPSLPIDAYLPLKEVSLELVEQLEKLAPFGPGNPGFTLAARAITVTSQQVIGRNEDHRTLIVEDTDGSATKVLWWQGAGYDLPEGRFDLAYRVRASSFRGSREVQIEWVHSRAIEEQPVDVRQAAPQALTDLRGDPNGLHTLAGQFQPGWQVWAEGDIRDLQDALPPGAVRGHDQLERGQVLVIATAPPTRAELTRALERVQPQQVILLNLETTNDQPDAFLKRLTGLARYTLKALDGQTSIAALAAATGQRQVTIRKGLEWLASRGHLTLAEPEPGQIHLSSGGVEDPNAQAQVEAGLKALLQETAAFRAYYRRADAGHLLATVTTKAKSKR
jgi:single-stranded-DNA-specific exonuclease